MATEETEVAPAADPASAAKSGSLLKAVGITLGLFVMMLVSQLTGPILGCKLLHSVMPGCAAPAEEADAADAKPGAAKDKGKKKDEPKAPPLYLAMDPPLVVSLQDGGTIRFLQVTVEVMAREEKVIEQVKTHTPVIRNNLLMMLGGQTLASLTNRDDKENLRKQALAEVQRILQENTGAPGVEDVYFTSFVVQ
jgi:flagellar protein FliL